MSEAPDFFMRGRERGSVAVEYGILLPALLLLVLGLIDVSRLVWTQTTLDRAVEAAARCGAVDSVKCGTAAAVQAYAAGEAYGMTIAATAFTVTSQSCGVSVSVQHPFELVIPWIARTDLTLTAEACYPA